MKTRQKIILLFSLFTSSLSAQITISGKVVDPNNLPVSFATVLLLNAQDSTSMLSGELTDENGSFEISSENAQTAFLQISSIEYQSLRILVNASLRNQIYQLAEGSVTLEQVEVRAKKPFFEQKIDRVVINIGSYESNAGGDALQALKNAPGVLINEQNGAISMNGKEGVLVMINDKLIRVPVNVLLTRLEGMKADNIVAIELIHQPPAKYDAGGNAGIINIVLKNRNEEGFNGSYGLSVGYGQREKAGANVQWNYRKGKANLYGNYSYTYNLSDGRYLIHHRSFKLNNELVAYDNRFDFQFRKIQQHAAQIGLDLEITPKTTLGLLSGIGDRNEQTNGHGASQSYLNNVLVDEIDLDSDTKNLTTSYFGNLNLFHRFDASQSINMDLDYAKYKLSSPGSFDNAISDVLEIPDAIRVDKNTPLGFWTFKVDYTKKIGAATSLELGAKSTMTTFENNADVQNLIDGNWVKDKDYSSFDKVKENILAAYGSLTFSLSKKTKVQAGLRYEKLYYDVTSNKEANSFKRDNSGLFPVLFVRHEIDSLSGLQFSYNRRVNRPSYRQLTANFIFFDPITTVIGNQYLTSGYSNAFVVRYNKNSFLFGLEYTHQNNGIFWRNIVEKETNIFVTQQRNLDTYRVARASVTVPVNITPWWRLNLSSALYRTWLNDDTDGRDYAIDLAKVTGEISVNNSFTLPKAISLELSGRYLSSRLTGEQEHRPFYVMNFGFQKKFQNGGSISLSMNDILNSSGKLNYEFYQPESTILTAGIGQWSERRIRVAFNQPFGNELLKAKRQRQSGSQAERNRL